MKEVLTARETLSPSRQQIQILKKHFPQCFDKNGAFMIHKMSEMMKDNDVPLSKEGYGLHWLGKSYARLLANDPPQTLLEEDTAHNAQSFHAHSQNLLIQGDNLEVLKHLVHAYSEKVKMIYIDPPYNTGSDGFVYQDNRMFTPEQLAELADISEEEAKRILDFTQRKSNSHSAWLTFMYPRLYIARELLREDGVIFISIDDNEQAQLKMLCDEIFGEENFFTCLVRRCMHTVRNSSKDFNINTDYVFVYGKDKSWFGENKDRYIRVITEKYERYPFDDNDGKGQYKLDPLSARNYFKPYTFIFQNGTEWSASNGRYPAYSIETLKCKEANNEIVFSGKEPKIKRYLKDVQVGQPPDALLNSKDVGFNSEGTIELREILGSGAIFSQPKNTKFISFLIQLMRDQNSLVLDFFAGSGTTAHAVMQLNAEDGGQRRCLSVQIDEPTDPKSEAFKAGYQTIFEITKARIEKAAVQIKAEHLDDKGDLGFKVFKTIPVFQGYLNEWNDINTTQDLFDGEQLTDQQLHSLLITWKVYDGIDLCQSLNPITLNTYTAYSVNRLIYLMHKGFNTEDLKVLITRLDEDKSFSPSKLILFGYNFDSKNQRQIKEALAQYTNKKHIEMDVVVRY